MTAQTKLLSPEREATACRKAFNGIKVGAIVQHCHHKQWLECLEETYELSSSNYRKLPQKVLRRLAEGRRRTQENLRVPMGQKDRYFSGNPDERLRQEGVIDE